MKRFRYLLITALFIDCLSVAVSAEQKTTDAEKLNSALNGRDAAECGFGSTLEFFMPTTSIANRVNKTVAFLLILASSHAFAASSTKPLLAFNIAKEEVICLGRSQGSAQNCDRTVNMTSLDSATKLILDRSDEALSLFSQKINNVNYVVFIARIPSKPLQSTGYCGAGHEDHLILLRYEENKLVLLDNFLLQSCLKSIVLDNDGDADILKSLTIDQENHAIRFRWINNPDDKSHRVTILNEKFLLN